MQQGSAATSLRTWKNYLFLLKNTFQPVQTYVVTCGDLESFRLHCSFWTFWHSFLTCGNRGDTTCHNETCEGLGKALRWNVRATGSAENTCVSIGFFQVEIWRETNRTGLFPISRSFTSNNDTSTNSWSCCSTFQVWAAAAAQVAFFVTCRWSPFLAKTCWIPWV